MEGQPAVGRVVASVIPELGDDVVDRLAREAHAAFRASRPSQHGTAVAANDGRSFGDLSRIEVEQNRATVRDIPTKLAAIGCGVSPEATTPAFTFSDDEVEILARLEHQRWVQTELSAVPRDVGRLERKSALLVPWDELDADERDKDRAVVRAIPRLLASVGMSVVRLESTSPARDGRQSPAKEEQCELKS